MKSRPLPLQPRKKPVQRRSIHTVECIYEATIQVLLDLGLERLTTTRVAERAGVSAGTLYQYFPNKRALLAGALHRHLSGVVEAIEHGCAESKGSAVDHMAREVVRAFVNAKMRDARASSALYGVAAEVEGAEVVAAMSQRAQAALRDLLATASDARFRNTSIVAYVWSTSMIGPVQGLLESGASEAVISEVCDHLQRLSIGYLRSEASS